MYKMTELRRTWKRYDGKRRRKNNEKRRREYSQSQLRSDRGSYKESLGDKLQRGKRSIKEGLQSPGLWWKKRQRRKDLEKSFKNMASGSNMLDGGSRRRRRRRRTNMRKTNKRRTNKRRTNKRRTKRRTKRH